MDDKTILRKPHNADNPYVVITKTIFEDDAISWRAKGMMGYLLSRPDDWTIIIGDLVKRAPEGRGVVRSTLRELEQHGYLLKHTLRDEHGRWAGTEMIVLEHPAPLEQRTYREKATAAQTPQTDSPHTEKPHTVDPHAENCPLLSTDGLLSTDLTEKEEEPPLADSPPDPEIDEIAASFKTPPPREPRTAEQAKAGIRHALEEHARNGNGRAGVADPTRDIDAWMDRPVKEWCAFIRLPYAEQSRGRLALLASDLRTIATTGGLNKTPQQVGEAIRAMTTSPSCEWMRSAGRPTHKEFTNVLTNVLCGQVLPEGNGRHDAAADIESRALYIHTEENPNPLGIRFVKPAQKEAARA